MYDRKVRRTKMKVTIIFPTEKVYPDDVSDDVCPDIQSESLFIKVYERGSMSVCYIMLIKWFIFAAAINIIKKRRRRSISRNGRRIRVQLNILPSYLR